MLNVKMSPRSCVSRVETIKGVHCEDLSIAESWTQTYPDPDNAGTTERLGLTFKHEVTSDGTRTTARIKILSSVFEKRFLHRGKVMKVRFAATDNLDNDVLSNVVTSDHDLFW